jgi:hypothetical protein
MRCAIALTKQHTITTSVLSLGASLLTRHIGWKQKKKVKKKSNSYVHQKHKLAFKIILK